MIFWMGTGELTNMLPLDTGYMHFDSQFLCPWEFGLLHKLKHSTFSFFNLADDRDEWESDDWETF